DPNLAVADFVGHAGDRGRQAAVLGPGKAGQTQTGRLAGVEESECRRRQEVRHHLQVTRWQNRPEGVTSMQHRAAVQSPHLPESPCDRYPNAALLDLVPQSLERGSGCSDVAFNLRDFALQPLKMRQAVAPESAAPPPVDRWRDGTCLPRPGACGLPPWCAQD